MSAIAEPVSRTLSLLERTLARPFEWARERRKLAACIAGPGTRLMAESSIVNPAGRRESIRIGAGSHLYGRLLLFAKSGEIIVGDHCFIGPGSQIWSADRVSIGSRVFLSHGVNIHDNNAHPLSAALRHLQFTRPATPESERAIAAVRTAPVVIEDDAWVGFNATVLKGIVIGRGAVIGAASVVTADVPPWTVVAGNPAQQIGMAEP